MGDDDDDCSYRKILGSLFDAADASGGEDAETIFWAIVKDATDEARKRGVSNAALTRILNGAADCLMTEEDQKTIRWAEIVEMLSRRGKHEVLELIEHVRANREAVWEQAKELRAKLREARAERITRNMLAGVMRAVGEERKK